jgi:hypothetical protein
MLYFVAAVGSRKFGDFRSIRPCICCSNAAANAAPTLPLASL